MRDLSIPPHSTASRTAFVLVGLVAAQVPSTLQEIRNPVVRAALQLAAVALIFTVGWFMQPPAPSRRP
ncbi:MAG TPA: hypothetical protein VN896_12290 [Methylomirabilota bacterium]|nr:hypothetical protein [Methylomirabilota bacterium]